jgi:hypothetical protein
VLPFSVKRLTYKVISLLVINRKALPKGQLNERKARRWKQTYVSVFRNVNQLILSAVNMWNL